MGSGKLQIGTLRCKIGGFCEDFGGAEKWIQGAS
jgi:hypothetical protein